MAELCRVYDSVGPILRGVLPFISLIPQIGAATAKALETLMALIEATCGALGGSIREAGDLRVAAAVVQPTDAEFLRALARFQ